MVSELGHAPYSFISAEVLDGSASQIYPTVPQPIQGRFVLSGILEGESAKIVVRYGRNGKVAKALR